MKEQDLIAQIRQGDQEAFGLLVKDLLPSAYKTAYLILKSKDLAEDALQNALEGAYISIMRSKEMPNFKAWFYRLIYSRSIDLYRKNSRFKGADYDGNWEAEVKMKVKSAQAIAIQRENKSEMMAQILRLKQEEGILIYLHYYEDLSVKEISLILSENVNTIKTRLVRGRHKLAKLLLERNNFSQEAKTNGI